MLLPLLVGGVSGYLSGSGINDWFRELEKPSFNPPSWVFGPVWTLLYLLMGVSLFRVMQAPANSSRNIAVSWFLIQLALNFMWSLIFFRWQLLAVAFAEIIVLWVAIMIMILKFYKIDKTAAFLQIPYLLWVTFATMLSGAFWLLNH